MSAVAYLLAGASDIALNYGRYKTAKSVYGGAKSAYSAAKGALSRRVAPGKRGGSSSSRKLDFKGSQAARSAKRGRGENVRPAGYRPERGRNYGRAKGQRRTKLRRRKR